MTSKHLTLVIITKRIKPEGSSFRILNKRTSSFITPLRQCISLHFLRLIPIRLHRESTPDVRKTRFPLRFCVYRGVSLRTSLLSLTDKGRDHIQSITVCRKEVPFTLTLFPYPSSSEIPTISSGWVKTD